MKSCWVEFWSICLLTIVLFCRKNPAIHGGRRTFCSAKSHKMSFSAPRKGKRFRLRHGWIFPLTVYS